MKEPEDVLEMGNMFAYHRIAAEEFCGNRNLDKVKALIGDVVNFEDWMKENKNNFKKVL